VTLSLLCAKSLPAKFGGLPLRPDVPKGSGGEVSCIGRLMALARPDFTTEWHRTIQPTVFGAIIETRSVMGSVDITSGKT
jgi:hypothetical protein